MWVARIRSRFQVFVCFMALVSLLAPMFASVHAQTVPQSEVRAIAERFLCAYQKKDIEALIALWSEQSPELAATKQALESAFSEPGGAQVKSFTVSRITLSGDKAAVRIVTEMTGAAGAAGATAEQPGTVNRALDLIKDHGSWKVWHYGFSEQDLASAIAAARSDEERKSLIEQDKELINIRLTTAMAGEGDKLVLQGEYTRASDLYQTTLELAERINDKLSLAQIYCGIGNIERRRGNYPKAMERYQDSLRRYEEVGNKAGIAHLLSNIAFVINTQGNNAEALRYLQRSLEIDQEIGDKKGTARALTNMANFQTGHVKYSEVLGTYEKSLRISEEIGDLQTAASTMMNIGLVYESISDHPAALEWYDKSLKIAQALGAKPKIADTLGLIANAFMEQGNFLTAQEYDQKSLALREQMGDKPGIAQTSHNIGVVEYHMGNYSRAQQSFESALHIEEELGLKPSMAVTLNSMGDLFRTLGNASLALEYFERGLTMSRESGADAASFLRQKAGLQRQRGDLDEARSTYEESLKLAEGSGNSALASLVLEDLGLLELEVSIGSAPGMMYLQKSLALNEQIGDKRRIVECLGEIASVYNQLGDYRQAVQTASRAALIAEEIGNSENLSGALVTQGRAYRALGRLTEARDALARAITINEQIRGMAAGSDQDRQRFMEARTVPYYAMAALAIDENKPSDALGFAERSKARVLVDIMESGRPSVTKAMTPEERDREREINSRLGSLNAQIVKERLSKEPDQERLGDLNSRVGKVRLEREAFQAELYSAHPDLRAQRAGFVPITLGECGGLIGDQKTALLEFVVSLDSAYLFVITKKDSAQVLPDLKAYKIDINPEDLTDLCNKFRGQLSQKGLGFHDLAVKLYALLLGPAAAELHDRTNLVIVPDGPLWGLPFQALQPNQDRYLIEDHAISYAPSLTALREMTKRARSAEQAGAPTTLLALGNPSLGAETSSEIKEMFMDADLAPLPQAEKQVLELGKLYGPAQSKIYTGAEATEGRLKAEAPTARILHIAAHGIVNNASPLYSQLVLSRGEGSQEDGLLEAWEIMNMDLKADLVVLAACDTAGGRYGAGEGMIGLSWAFFVAGCPTTVVSQWSAEAESTSQLMVEFHRNLLSGLTKAEALRRAELKLLKGDIRYRRPYYWAPFVVIGTAN
ncbi:MAG TPA: CHAT domain-containing protein [Blastocatellia bacterium]